MPITLQGPAVASKSFAHPCFFQSENHQFADTYRFLRNPPLKMLTLIRDCNQTMRLQPRTLGTAIHENLTLHSALCRREAGSFQKAAQSGDDVVMACTQKSRLFAELAQQTEGATSVIRFVNIRETGGWSKDGALATPKIAALLALAHMPDAESVATVICKSAGRLLIIGELDVAKCAAEQLSDVLNVTLFSLGTCATVCPTGAMSYASLPASEQGVKLKTLLASHARARWRCLLRQRTTICRPSLRRSRFPETPDCRHKPHDFQR